MPATAAPALNTLPPPPSTWSPVPDAPRWQWDDVEQHHRGQRVGGRQRQARHPGRDSDLDNTNAELSITGIRNGTEASGGVMSAIAAGTTSADGTIIAGLYGGLRIGADGEKKERKLQLHLDIAQPGGGTPSRPVTPPQSSATPWPIGRPHDVAQLTITIDGVTDGGPSITPVDGNGAATGETTVFEAGLTTVADTSETGTGSIT